jgi:1-phosphofructokinase
VTAGQVADLDGLLRFWLQAAKVLVVAGSIPAGVPTDMYSRLIEAANARGVRTVLDADGEAFRLGIRAHPYLIKPNVAEAERFLGRCLPDVSAVAVAARELASGGVGMAVISMGAQGAVCVGGGGPAPRHGRGARHGDDSRHRAWLRRTDR